MRGDTALCMCGDRTSRNPNAQIINVYVPEFKLDHILKLILIAKVDFDFVGNRKGEGMG